MNKIRPLHSSQTLHGGTAACCVIAMLVANHFLHKSEKPSVETIEQLTERGSALWKALDCGFLAPHEVLQLLSNELPRLAIASELHAHVGGALFDDEEKMIVPDAEEAMMSYLEGEHSVAVVTRGGYTFTVYCHEGAYYIIDTHSNALYSRVEAIRRTHSIAEEWGESGALIEYYFPVDVARYVVDMMQQVEVDEEALTSANELEITVLRLD